MASDYEVIKLLNKHIDNWPVIKQKIIKELFTSYMERNPKWSVSFDPTGLQNPYDIRPFEIFYEVTRSFIDVNDNSEFSWKINKLSNKENTCHRYTNELESAFETYIYYRNDASSKTLELWLLRALAYAEISTFNVENGLIINKYKSPRKIILPNIIFFLIVLSCAIMIGMEYSAAVGFLSFLSVGYLHIIHHHNEMSVENKIRQTHNLMVRFYEKLTSHDFISPSEIERYANEAKQSGALWPYGMYDIIKMAKDRSPLRWE